MTSVRDVLVLVCCSTAGASVIVDAVARILSISRGIKSLESETSCLLSRKRKHIVADNRDGISISSLEI